ncbi:EboA domain-containing protein [Georgenia sp. Z1491]|uniref:EboA domain-containing protein n=1 Tax=Georgenia sp. Z1491 TaxID=3416707 RepID=UPI003CF86A33
MTTRHTTSDAWALGYGTNGFADHRLADALDVMAETGYQAVALTIGHPHLDPFADGWRESAEALAADLDRRGFRSVVETGTRYLLDPRRKHRPTLVDRDADARTAFLRRAVEIAQVLRADCVSLWSGVLPEDVTADEGWDLMVGRLAELVPFAAERGVVLSIEPEPGMLVETVADALRLRTALGEPEGVGITVDLGHCVAVEPDGVVGALRAAGTLLRNVQVDDMLPGVHEHLELGAGELDLIAAIATLREIGYAGVAAVELPRHSHDAPRLARTSLVAWEAAAEAPGAAATADGTAGAPAVEAGATTGAAAARDASARDPWTATAVAAVTEEPARATRLFAEAGRKVGRAPLDPTDTAGFGGTADDEARATIVRALKDAGAGPDTVRALYEHGDDSERRGVLRGLGTLTASGELDDDWRATGLDLTADALRTNDPRLVAAAMGPLAAAHLDAHAWRHGVLKLVFMGVPLSVVAGLDDRRDAELAAMAARFAEERRAAGRTVPDDLHLIDEQPQTHEQPHIDDRPQEA